VRTTSGRRLLVSWAAPAETVAGVTRPVDRRAEALRRLPAAYSLAVELRDAGVAGAMIAARLGIEPVALGPLLIVAEAKLRAILEEFSPE